MSSKNFNGKKVQEGDEYMKNANKYIAKTMFKWSADYLSAAPLFEKASAAYRAGGDAAKAINALEKAAEAHHKNGGSFKAAQQMETAAKICIEKYKAKNPQKGAANAKAFYRRAAGYYNDRGELGKAADALKKCAEMLDGLDNTSACELYFEACDLMETQDKPHYSIECFRKALGFVVKIKRYQDALNLIQRMIPICVALEQPSNVHKYCLSITILHLAMGDIVAADRSFTEHLQDDGYLHSNECHLAEDLVIAFKNSNEESLQEVLKKQGFNYLDNQIGRLAKKLSLYTTAEASGVKKPTGKVKPPPKQVNLDVALDDFEFTEEKPRHQSKSPPKPVEEAFGDMNFEEAKTQVVQPPPPTAAVPDSLDDALDNFDFGEEEDESNVSNTGVDLT